MQPLPHHYRVTAAIDERSNVELASSGLMPITSAPPAEFGGPGNLWSPETLLVAAVADCFVLTFRSIATASRLEWTKIVCEGTGKLERLESITRFTGIDLYVRLGVPTEAAAERARALLAKTEKACLVTNSLGFGVTLQSEVEVETNNLSDAFALTMR